MLSIGGDDLEDLEKQFSPFFDIGGDDLAKLTRRQIRVE